MVAAGVWLTAGPPRLTVLNTALRLDHPGRQSAGALLAACGFALAGAAARRLPLRLLSAVPALVALAAAAHLAVYRVELTQQALVDEGLLRRTEIPWDRIQRVEVAPSALLVFRDRELLLRIEMGGFSPDQQATLKRGIARRVREAYQPEASAP